MKKLIILTFAAVMLFTLSSCGYQVGSLMHPQVKTIAIGNVSNESTEYNVSVQLQQLLSEQFMLDGSLKVTDRRTADAIIYAKILSVSYAEIAGRDINDGTYTPVEWRVTARIEFSVIIPGEERPLIPLTTVSGSTALQVTADMGVGRQRALYMACRDAAEKMVQKTTEAW